MSYLDEFSRLSGKILVDGAYLASAATEHFDVIDPATEEVLAQIADTTDAEVDQVIEISAQARKNWLALDPRSRAIILHDMTAAMRRESKAYAVFMTREMGKPFKEAVDEVAWCGTAFDYYAELGRHQTGRIAGPTVPGQLHFSVKEPLGTVALILPFNFPLTLFAWVASAALAAGNSLIVKPHEQTSITTLKFMELLSSLPPGLVQVITGGPRVAQRLVHSPKVHCVAYTGSVPIAQDIARTCANSFKRVLIEASGNDPFLVMPSASMETAARGAVFAKFINAGQVCTSGERFYVHEKIHDEFVERVLGEVRKLRVGNPLENVDMGPLATIRQRDRLEGLISRTIKEGATLVQGGGRPAGLNRGWYMEPTVFTDVKPEMEILNNETFGPVMPICKVSSFDEAMALANASNFGLAANLYSNDMNETMRAVAEMESGMLWVNAPLLDNDALPFGGRKLTGTGRQLGPEGLAQFQNDKFVIIDPQATTQDFWWFPYADAEAYAAYNGQS